MTKREQIEDDYPDEPLAFWDGLDDAILGVSLTGHITIVYSYDLLIKYIDEDFSKEDALEYIEYNIMNAYIGERTPIIIDTY